MSEDTRHARRVLVLLIALVAAGGLMAGCMADDTTTEGDDDTDTGFGENTDPGRETAEDPSGTDDGDGGIY